MAQFVDVMADQLTFGVMNLGLILLCVGLMLNIPRGRDIAIAVIVLAAILEFVLRQIKSWKARKAERRRDLEMSDAAAREWDLLSPSGASPNTG